MDKPASLLWSDMYFISNGPRLQSSSNLWNKFACSSKWDGTLLQTLGSVGRNISARDLTCWDQLWGNTLRFLFSGFARDLVTSVRRDWAFERPQLPRRNILYWPLPNFQIDWRSSKWDSDSSTLREPKRTIRGAGSSSRKKSPTFEAVVLSFLRGV